MALCLGATVAEPVVPCGFSVERIFRPARPTRGDTNVRRVLESPDDGKDGKLEARSDCHAWGSHPLWFMQTGLAGIRSAAPGFARVLVAPQPGPLRSLTARHPHPDGWIAVDLEFDGDRAHGSVTTPVAGEFRYAGMSRMLAPGRNEF